MTDRAEISGSQSLFSAVRVAGIPANKPNQAVVSASVERASDQIATRKGERVNVGSLFTGIGGLDLAVGGDHAWMCEYDKHCRGVLAERFPGVPCYPDVRELRAAITHGESRRNETGTDTMGRPNLGRPGASTPTPSTAGNTPSDDPPPGQLTIEAA